MERGQKGFNFTSSKIDPLLGNPTSKLTYDGMHGNSAKLFFRTQAQNEGNIFAKGFVGGGWLTRTSSPARPSSPTPSAGSRAIALSTAPSTWDTTSGATKLTVGSLAGFNFWQETQVGFGARCNRDDVDGAVCGPPGGIEVPFSTKVIRNQPNWASLRLGAELRVRLWDRLSLIADAARRGLCLERG